MTIYLDGRVGEGRERDDLHHNLLISRARWKRFDTNRPPLPPLPATPVPRTGHLTCFGRCKGAGAGAQCFRGGVGGGGEVVSIHPLRKQNRAVVEKSTGSTAITTSQTIVTFGWKKPQNIPCLCMRHVTQMLVVLTFTYFTSHYIYIYTLKGNRCHLTHVYIFAYNVTPIWIHFIIRHHLNVSCVFISTSYYTPALRHGPKK